MPMAEGLVAYDRHDRSEHEHSEACRDADSERREADGLATWAI